MALTPLVGSSRSPNFLNFTEPLGTNVSYLLPSTRMEKPLHGSIGCTPMVNFSTGHAIETRFAPSHYEDPKGALFKLCQISTVKHYQTQFETLANRIIVLPPPFNLSYFISGLKSDIRREVQAFQPISLAHAISLAKLQEEKPDDIPTQHRPLHPPTFSNPITLTHSFPTKATFKPSRPTSPKPFIKNPSPAELQERGDKGLCYNCDDC